MKKILHYTAPLLAIAASLSAQTIVNFDGTAQIDSNQNMRGSGSLIESFSDTVAYSPGSGYTGQTFYGGHATVSGTELVSPPQNIRLSSVTQSFQYRIQTNLATNSTPATIANAFTSVVIFDKTDFLNGGDSQTNSLSAGNQFSMTAVLIGGNSSDSSQNFAVVRNGAQYCISQASFAIGQNTSATAVIDVGTTLWALYDPTTIRLTGSETYSIASSSLTHVTAVGFYVENLVEIGGNYSAGRLGIQVENFTAQVAIPEPSTYAVMAGLAALGLGLLRRKRA